MCSRRLLVISFGLLFSFACAGGASPVAAFVASQFDTLPAMSLLPMSGEVARAVQAIMGYPCPTNAVSYWQAEGKTVWVLEGRGRTRPFTAGFVVREGCLEKTEVLVYRESHGRQIRTPSFTRQFDGVRLTRANELDRRIDGITGATLSVRSMQNLARQVLWLESLRMRQQGNSP